MRRDRVEPVHRVRPQIEIDQRGESEREKRARQLRAIRLQQRARVDRSIAGGMNVRIDEARIQALARDVDALRAGRRLDARSDLSDLSVAYQHRRVPDAL